VPKLLAADHRANDRADADLSMTRYIESQWTNDKPEEPTLNVVDAESVADRFENDQDHSENAPPEMPRRRAGIV